MIELETELELVGEVEDENVLVGEMDFDTSSGGTSNYAYLTNKPKINNVELINNKTLEELGIQEKGEYPKESLTNSDIEALLNNFV